MDFDHLSGALQDRLEDAIEITGIDTTQDHEIIFTPSAANSTKSWRPDGLIPQCEFVTGTAGRGNVLHGPDNAGGCAWLAPATQTTTATVNPAGIRTEVGRMLHAGPGISVALSGTGASTEATFSATQTPRAFALAATTDAAARAALVALMSAAESDAGRLDYDDLKDKPRLDFNIPGFGCRTVTGTASATNVLHGPDPTGACTWEADDTASGGTGEDAAGVRAQVTGMLRAGDRITFASEGTGADASLTIAGDAASVSTGYGLTGDGLAADPVELSDALKAEIDAVQEAVAVKGHGQAWTLTAWSAPAGNPTDRDIRYENGYLGASGTSPTITALGTIAPVSNEFTDGVDTWRLVQIRQGADEGAIQLVIGVRDPVNDASPVTPLPTGWRLIVERGAQKVTLSAHNATFRPEDQGGLREWPSSVGSQWFEQRRIWEWIDQPAGLLAVGATIEISVPAKKDEVCDVGVITTPGYLCTRGSGADAGKLIQTAAPLPSDGSITPDMLEAGEGERFREKIGASGVVWSEARNVDTSNDDWRVVALENNRAHRATLRYDANDTCYQANLGLTEDVRGNLQYCPLSGTDSQKGRWKIDTVPLDTSRTLSTLFPGGKTIDELSVHVVAPSGQTAAAAFTVALEADSSIANTFSMIAKTALAADPTYLTGADTPIDAIFNFVFTDDSKVWPDESVLVQGVVPPDTIRALGRTDDLKSLSITGSFPGNAVFSWTSRDAHGTETAHTFTLTSSGTPHTVTLSADQVEDLAGAIDAQAPWCSYAADTDTLTCALRAQDIPAGSIDSTKIKASDAANILQVLGAVGLDAIALWARATSTEDVPDDRLSDNVVKLPISRSLDVTANTRLLGADITPPVRQDVACTWQFRDQAGSSQDWYECELPTPHVCASSIGWYPTSFHDATLRQKFQVFVSNTTAACVPSAILHGGTQATTQAWVLSRNSATQYRSDAIPPPFSDAPHLDPTSVDNLIIGPQGDYAFETEETDAIGVMTASEFARTAGFKDVAQRGTTLANFANLRWQVEEQTPQTGQPIPVTWRTLESYNSLWGPGRGSPDREIVRLDACVQLTSYSDGYVTVRLRGGYEVRICQSLVNSFHPTRLIVQQTNAGGQCTGTEQHYNLGNPTFTRSFPRRPSYSYSVYEVSFTGAGTLLTDANRPYYGSGKTLCYQLENDAQQLVWYQPAASSLRYLEADQIRALVNPRRVLDWGSSTNRTRANQWLDNEWSHPDASTPNLLLTDLPAAAEMKIRVKAGGRTGWIEGPWFLVSSFLSLPDVTTTAGGRPSGQPASNHRNIPDRPAFSVGPAGSDNYNFHATPNAVVFNIRGLMWLHFGNVGGYFGFTTDHIDYIRQNGSTIQVWVRGY